MDLTTTPPRLTICTIEAGSLDHVYEALTRDAREHEAEIEENGDGALTVTGAPSRALRDWLLVRYDEAGQSPDGRGVIWYPKGVPDA